MPGNDQVKGQSEVSGAGDDQGQSRVSRRSLLGAAGIGAAGLAAGAFGGIAAAAPAAASVKPAAPVRPAGRSAGSDSGTAAGQGAGAGHVVVHLRAGNGGELDVFSGTSHTRVHDPDLAARLRRTIR